MSIKYVAAALLLHTGETAVTEEGIKRIIQSVSNDIDNDLIKHIIENTKEKSINEIINEGKSNFVVSVSSNQPSQAAAEEVKTAEPEAKEEESDIDLGFSLFD